MEHELLNLLKLDQEAYMNGVLNKHQLPSYQRFLEANNKLALFIDDNKENTQQFKEIERLSALYYKLYEQNSIFFDNINYLDEPPLPNFTCHDNGAVTLKKFCEDVKNVGRDSMIIISWYDTCVAKRGVLEKNGWLESSNKNKDEIIVFPGLELFHELPTINILMDKSDDYYDITDVCIRHKLSYSFSLEASDDVPKEKNIISIINGFTDTSNVYYLNHDPIHIMKVTNEVRNYCQKRNQSLALYTYRVDYHETFGISETQRYINQIIKNESFTT